MSEQLRHRQLRAQVQREDMPVRRVRALSVPLPITPSIAPPAVPSSCPPGSAGPRARLGHVAYSGHVGRFFKTKAISSLPVQVRKGQPLGVVKALGMEFPVLAPCAGWVDTFDVPCGNPVEYGQAVAALRTEG